MVRGQKTLSRMGWSQLLSLGPYSHLFPLAIYDSSIWTGVDLRAAKVGGNVEHASSFPRLEAHSSLKNRDNNPYQSLCHTRRRMIPNRLSLDPSSLICAA